MYNTTKKVNNIRKQRLILKKETIDYGLIFFVLLGVFLNCFFLFVIGTIYILYKKPKKYELRLWGWIGVLFVSLLSMTKVPESDLGWIIDHFHQAGTMSYVNYLALLGKEPLYQSFSYLMHYVLANDEKIFILVLSIISMSLLYVSLYTFCEKVRVNKFVFVTCVYLMLFFPFFFGAPVHIVRQTMALSLFIFVFVNKICGKNKYWPLALCTPFFHSTAFFCLPFLFLGYLKKPVSIRTLIIYGIVGAVFFSIQKISSFLLPLLTSSDSTVAYALERASRDTDIDSRVVEYQMFITYTIGLLLLYFIWKNRLRLKQHEEINYFSNFIILVIIFLISSTGQDQLQGRFNLLIWQYLAFIACVFLKFFRIEDFLLSVFCMIIFFVWWYYELYVTPFEFKGIGSFWYYTIFNYYYPS